MLQRWVPHHNTGGFTSHRVRLPDKEYGEALDCLVKGCSDLLILSSDASRILLGRRKVQPQPDWWFVGGRIFPGETPAQSSRRLLKRELALDIDVGRFEPVCTQSLVWGMREQLPKEHGTCDLQVVLSLRLEAAEAEKVVLDPDEYLDSQWLTPDEILEGVYHPALKFAVSSMLTVRKFKQLQAVVKLTADNDVEIAALARELVSLAQNAPPAGISAYRVNAPHLPYDCDVEVQL